MNLFEVQRLLERWPSLRGGQDLRTLFMKFDSIDGVWIIPGHVFISYKKDDLHSLVQCFSQLPLKVGGVGGGASPTSTGSCEIPMTSRVIEILSIRKDAILIVEENGRLLPLSYNTDNGWGPPEREEEEEGGEAAGQLFVGRGDIVGVCLCTTGKNNKLIYCLKENEEGQDEWCHSIYTTQFSFDGGIKDLSDCSQLLSQSPKMCFYPVQNGVWLIPASGSLSPPNLMLYWDYIQTLVWSGWSFIETSGQLKDFKMITRRTVSAWSKEESSRELAVSFTVHPVTQLLLCLTSTGYVYEVSEKDGSRSVFVELLDFMVRYPSVKFWYSSTTPTDHELFILHTYIGICLKGELRLYDRSTGEFIWECDDLDHPTTRLVSSSFVGSPLTPITLWNQSGIYMLRCRKVVDHAVLFVDGLFPIATNADETTPGEFLEEGETVAAELCFVWGLDMLASQYTVKQVHKLLKERSSNRVVHLPERLLKLLTALSARSPLICVALLTQYPLYRGLLTNLITRYLAETDNNDAVKSPLAIQTIPLLKQYLTLSQQYEDLLTMPTSPSVGIPSVKDRVVEILKCSQQSTLKHDPTVKLKAELTYYSHTDPMSTLSGIKDFMKIPTTFADKRKQVNVSEFDYNWRNLLASEVPEKIPDKSLKPASPIVNIPIFELTVQLLYSHQPDDLVHFVTFVHQAREAQLTSDLTYSRQCKKGHFYQRALDVITPPTSTASSDKVFAYCQLLLSSDCASAEIKALSLLLEHKEWPHVIDMLNEVYSKVQPSVQSALFYNTLLHMSKEGILSQYITTLWPFLPDAFSVHSFIDILKCGDTVGASHALSEGGGGDQICVKDEDTNQLKLENIIPYILQLLSR
ncbi:PREDICTED: uncharacterized protein LOC109582486 [Amphimedon queenslandica]|uniref:BLOC-2 complex member HPS6 C-terminal domain-containing protein n=1 Tax=Amphimedon queenslandica TaxID=400682 RepID=A0A1X7VVD1_AMPQE|nr:PREDICTED: uncharacterized protein LOC109582486 [Amphimedon queenslandica]|eukprot:XP_019852772.1 PREDICTED: uncharacterized protein LOC109582486 [Amphimedon queenslandica]